MNRSRVVAPAVALALVFVGCGGASEPQRELVAARLEEACGSCHGIPPASHPTTTDCGMCHDGYTATTVNDVLHQNGVVDWIVSCSSCHGDPSRVVGPKEAPPRDTFGNLSTTARGVGAHQAHLTDGQIALAIACTECHPVTTMDTPTHRDGFANVVFGPNEWISGLTPAWDPVALTCSSIYCHGATLAGGTHRTPLWTKVDGTQRTCDSCHGAPPPAPHVPDASCGACHFGYTATTVNVTTHVNGVIDAAAGLAPPTFTAVGATSLTVSWVPAAGATAYSLERARDLAGTPGGFMEIASRLTSTSYLDAGLLAGTTYWYRVRAINGMTSGPYSAASCVTTLALPGAPGTPVFSAVAQTTLTVSWSAAIDTVTYAVERGDTATGPWSSVASGVPATVWSDAGLQRRTTYWYRVRGVNAAGAGPYSAAASVKTTK